MGIDAIDAARENQRCGTNICFSRRKEVAGERVDILKRRVGAKSGTEPHGILLSKARFKSRFSYLKIKRPTPWNADQAARFPVRIGDFRSGMALVRAEKVSGVTATGQK